MIYIYIYINHIYSQISNIRCTKTRNINLVSCSICLCAIYWSQVLSPEWRYSWSRADRQCFSYISVGAVLTCNAPTTSERSTILLPTEVPLILEIYQYMKWCLFNGFTIFMNSILCHIQNLEKQFFFSKTSINLICNNFIFLFLCNPIY